MSAQLSALIDAAQDMLLLGVRDDIVIQGKTPAATMHIAKTRAALKAAIDAIQQPPQPNNICTL